MRARQPDLSIRLGAPVKTREGRHVGNVDRVVVDPDGGRLTHVVVHAGGLLARDVVVPSEAVERASPDSLWLRLSAGDLQSLPDFVEAEYVPLESQDEPPIITWEGAPSYEPRAVLVPAATLYDPPVKPYAPQIVEEHENIPYGTTEIVRGSRVQCTDGFLGTVQEVRVDPSSRRVDSFVVEPEGGVERWVVPADAIQQASHTLVRLRVARCELRPADEREEVEEAS